MGKYGSTTKRTLRHPASAAKGNSSKRQIAIYSEVTLLSAPCDSRLVCRAAEDEFGGEKGLTSDDRGSGDDRRGRGR